VQSLLVDAMHAKGAPSPRALSLSLSLSLSSRRLSHEVLAAHPLPPPVTAPVAAQLKPYVSKFTPKIANVAASVNDKE
jgi:hypothetical protein